MVFLKCYCKCAVSVNLVILKQKLPIFFFKLASFYVPGNCEHGFLPVIIFRHNFSNLYVEIPAFFTNLVLFFTYGGVKALHKGKLQDLEDKGKASIYFSGNRVKVLLNSFENFTP